MRALACLAFALPLVACGSIPATTDGGGDGDAGPDAAADPCMATSVSLEQFFTCVNRAACDLISDCFGSSTELMNCDDLPINLFDGLSIQSARAILDHDVTSGRAQWNPTEAAACLARLHQRSCALLKTNDDFLDGCHAIVGNVLDGAACQAGFECATDGARCEAPMGGTTCGSQVCRKPAATGQPCTGGAFCGPADHCVRRIVGGTDLSVCQPGTAGSACDRGDDCDPDLFCNGGLNDGSASGTCTAAKPAGAICRDDRECQGQLMCVGETSTTTGTCRDTRAPGAPCDDLFSCFGHQYCAGAANTVGTCTPAIGVGAACGTSAGQPWCGATLACEGGMCGGAGTVGAPCTRSSDGVFAADPNGCNTGLHCSNAISGGTSGTCEAPLPDGRACRNDDHCQHGYCDPTTSVCGAIPVCSL